MIISFSGLDGVGKTTHSRLVIEFLKKNNIKFVYIPVHGYSIFNLVRKFMDKFSDKMSKKIVDEEYDIHKKNFSRFVIRVLREITFLLDILRFYVRILFEKIRGNVIVCDRYFYDMIIQTYYLGLCGRVYLRFYSLLIPKPTFPFFLYLDYKKAFDRAKQYYLDYFKDKSKLYEHLLGVEFIRLDSKYGIDLVQKKIQSLVSASILKK